LVVVAVTMAASLPVVAASVATAGPVGAPRCTVVGTPGDDVLRGTPGRDVVCGLGGDDDLRGRAEDDRLIGGPGDDRLVGGAGDDVLKGGRGRDALVGGTGRNLCFGDRLDSWQQCASDEDAPDIGEVRLSRTEVDVTDSSAEVVVKVRVTDDTAVARVDAWLRSDDLEVQLRSGYMEPISGGPRAGWWRGVVTVPRYARPGLLKVDVNASDGHGRMTDSERDHGVMVVDDNPDLQAPALELLAPRGEEPVDVRTAPAEVRIRVHATDDLSGVADLYLCLERPDADRYVDAGCAATVRRVSGTRRDGVWSGTVPIPRGSTGGDWNVVAYVDDRSEVERNRYLGPDSYQDWYEHGVRGEIEEFPDGAGRVPVLGRTPDVTPPTLRSVRLTPDRLDVRKSDGFVRVTARATDAPGEGVRHVTVVMVTADMQAGDPSFDQVRLSRVSGTAADGRWRGRMWVPQGTPPGLYYIELFVQDRNNLRSYASASWPGLGGTLDEPIASDPTVRVVRGR